MKAKKPQSIKHPPYEDKPRFIKWLTAYYNAKRRPAKA